MPNRKMTCFLTLMFCLLVSISPLSALQQIPNPRSSVQEIQFDVATVKRSPAELRSWKMEFTLDGFTARGVTVKEVVQEAYGIYESERIVGGPAWLASDRFDIEAKTDSVAVGDLRKLSLSTRRVALQRLLLERFKLAVHHQSRELPIYALYVAPRGMKLRPTADQDSPGNNEIEGYDGLVKRSSRGFIEVEDISVSGFAELLAHNLLKPVVDDTKINGRFDITFHWTPDDAATPRLGNYGGEPEDTTWPSLPAALREELGLDIKPEKRPVDCIVIDNASAPSAN